MTKLTKSLLLLGLGSAALLGGCASPGTTARGGERAGMVASATPQPMRFYSAADKGWEREPPFGSRRNNSVED